MIKSANPLLTACLALSLLAPAAPASKFPPAPERDSVSRQQMKFLLSRKSKLLLVAVMDKTTFSQSHLAGSISTSFENGVQDISDKVADRTTPIIIYGLEYSDPNPAKLREALTQAGFLNVRIYGEGLRGLISSDIALEGEQAHNPRIPRKKKRFRFGSYDNPLFWPLLLLIKPHC